jgi:hypothetical protein
MATIEMKVGEKVLLALAPTKNNLSADLQGIPQWVSANTAIATVQPSIDGLNCQVTAIGTGSTTVTATAQGATSLNANHTIQVAAANSNLATALAITIQSPPQLPTTP